MIAHFRLFAKKFAAMVSGEAMQSAFHFYLNLVLVQILSAHDYGIFAIVMVIGGVGLTYVRAFAAMPVSIWVGRSRSRKSAQAYDVTFGSGALLLSMALGAATAVVLHVWIGEDALAGGFFVFLWCIRSYLRISMFAFNLQRTVLLADGVFTIVGLLLSVILLYGTGDRLQTSFAILLIANACGLIAALVVAGRAVRIHFGASVRRRYKSLWSQLGWSGVSVTNANIQGQILSILVAGIAGPAAYAPIAAGLVLFVPLRIISAALVNMMQPVLAGLMARGEIAKMMQQARAWTVLMGLGSFIYGFVMILVMPHVKVQVFQGAPIYVIGFCCWAIYSATMLYVMPRVILEAANAFREIAIITAAGGVVGMGVVLVLLHVAAPSWSLIGGLVSELFILLACWLVVNRKFPVPKPDAPPVAAKLRPSPIARFRI